MAKKLVMLCAEAIAKDSSETGHLRLRTFLESTLPTPVILVALSSVPLNHLIQLEEGFPEHFSVITKQWKGLCKKCAKKHLPFRKKYQHASENLDEGLDYKAFLLNAYFQEVLDACSVAATKTTVRRSAKAPRVSSQYILQEALGQSRHTISDEKMLNVLAERITELTLSSKYILELRRLIQANKNCMRRLKTLKLDTCTYYSQKMKTTDWTYCVKHILQRSPIQILSITSCCTILNNILCLCVKGRQVDDATLGLESDVNGPRDSGDVPVPAAPEHLGIKELIVLQCSQSQHDTAKRQRAYCSGLECFYSLERLTVSCNTSKKLTDMFLCAITKLLICGSSQLKYLCIGGAFWNLKQITELGRCLNAANDSKKEVIINNCELEHYSIPTGDGRILVPWNCPKFSKSTISSLTYSDMLLDYRVASGFEWFYYEPLFTVLLKVYNPEYFNICCDYKPLALPNHSLQDVPTSGKGSKLRKLTVGLNICSYILYVHMIQPLHAVLRTVNLILKERSKEVDVHTFYEGEKPSDIHNSFFKTVEMTPLKKKDSAHSIEDFAAEM